MIDVAKQGIDHRITYIEDIFFFVSGFNEMIIGYFRSGEKVICDTVSHDPVDLFGH